MERLLDEASFSASDHATGETLIIDADYVDQHLGAYRDDQDLSKFIL
jgi:ATP-dependent HslUV protease ATP-binding subunit HslU